MKVAIVYDSSTGKTEAAAEQMAEMARGAGHDCEAESIHDADPPKSRSPTSSLSAAGQKACS